MKGIGRIQDVKTSQRHIVASGEHAKLELVRYSDNVLRITARLHHEQHPSSKPNPYAVIQSEDTHGALSFEAQGNHYQISGMKFRVEMEADNSRLTFSTLDGRVINADDFGILWNGEEVGCYKKIHAEERFVGLGEKTGHLNRRQTAFSNWNTDYLGYPESARELYSTIPFYMGCNDGLWYGIFFDNSHRSKFNFGASNHRFAYFSAEAGLMDYYFIHGENPATILSEYKNLTGATPMPPKWALGLQQCRYSYYPDTEFIRLAQTYREKDIPCDVLYYDIHYMDAYKVFTWDKDRFPDPKRLNQELKALGFHTVTIVDPGIKEDDNYSIHKQGKEGNVYLTYPDGSPWTADVWPGKSSFPDYTKPLARSWWASQFAQLKQDGVAGFWNDMNEPASWGQDTPNIVQFDWEGQGTSHKEGRNVYGMQMSRATYEGARQASNGERPFILTRATYAGGQRFAAKWTGDNVASNEHMLMGSRMITSLGLSGFPFSGYDVGGFMGEGDKKLFARWFSIAAFSPFFRCHKMINSNSAEPWTYGEEVTEIARNYAKLRYRLMPLLYSLFYEAHTKGMPIQRSLCMQYGQEEEVWSQAYDSQFMLGDDLLICPVPSDQSISKVYLPKGDWFDFYSDKHYAGGQAHLVESPLHRLPVFVRAGGILPMQSSIAHTGEYHDGILRLHLYLGDNDNQANQIKNSLVIYDDDEKLESPKSVSLNLSLHGNALTMEQESNGHPLSFETIRLYWHEKEGQASVQGCTIDGKAQSIKRENLQHLLPISNFDPFYEDGDGKDDMLDLPYIDIPSNKLDKEVSVTWEY